MQICYHNQQLRHLVVRGVDTLGSQQLQGLLDQVGPATQEHPEAQVQLELGRHRSSIQTLEGLEAAL